MKGGGTWRTPLMPCMKPTVSVRPPVSSSMYMDKTSPDRMLMEAVSVVLKRLASLTLWDMSPGEGGGMAGGGWANVRRGWSDGGWGRRGRCCEPLGGV